jgi:hypothetical protein
MKTIADAAFVVSVHDYVFNGVRVNLKWKGNHDISDFNLDVLGEVVKCDVNPPLPI